MKMPIISHRFFYRLYTQRLLLKLQLQTLIPEILLLVAFPLIFIWLKTLAQKEPHNILIVVCAAILCVS